MSYRTGALLGEEGVSGEVLRKKREDSRPPTELACEGREGLPGLRKSQNGAFGNMKLVKT